MRTLFTAMAVPQSLFMAAVATSARVSLFSGMPTTVTTPWPRATSRSIFRAFTGAPRRREAYSSRSFLASRAASSAAPPPQYTPRVAWVHTS